MEYCLTSIGATLVSSLQETIDKVPADAVIIGKVVYALNFDVLPIYLELTNYLTPEYMSEIDDFNTSNQITASGTFDMCYSTEESLNPGVSATITSATRLQFTNFQLII